MIGVEELECERGHASSEFTIPRTRIRKIQGRGRKEEIDGQEARGRLCVIASWLVWLILFVAPPASAASLTESARLAAVYDSILGARFDEAQARLASACPPAPVEACLALRAAMVWWQIQLDPRDRRHDRLLDTLSRQAIAAAARWTEREPRRAEAWFYLAGAYAPLTQWRVLRGERLAAARDAKRIKDALERATALDPTLHDAYFGIGLYHYYADVAPAALKVLRFLLLMPGGDREQGLREMQQARAQGVLLAGEADFQLHYLYLWYEHDPGRALALLRGLDARYPGNPLFLDRIAEVQRDYVKDHVAARAASAQLLDRALARRVERADLAEARARLGMAEASLAINDAQGAIDAVAPVIAAAPPAPYGAISDAHLVMARAYVRLGDRSRAIAALDQAIARAPGDDPARIRARARTLRSQLQSAR
jgi:hypothetical protein